MRSSPLWAHSVVNPTSDGFKDLPEGEEIAFVPLEAVWPSGRADFTRTRQWNRKEAYSQFVRGDILVPKITPTFEAGRACIADIPTELGLASTEVHVLRPGPTTDPRWLCYWMQSSHFLDFGAHNLQGVGNLRRITTQFLLSFPLVECPLPTQRAISDYLDRETAQIDAMAAELDGLESELLSRRDAEWGSLYAEVIGAEVAVQYLVESIADGPFGSALTSSHYSDSGCRVIRLGNIGVDEFRDSDHAYIPEEYGRELSRHSVASGDVLMAGLGDEKMPLGRACLVPDSALPAIVKADCYRLRPRMEAVSGEFLAWALSSPPLRELASLNSRGSTRARLNTEIAKSLRVRVPDLSTQARIVNDWRSSSSTIDSMIADAKKLKALLAERRSALITEVVTGRKEVPTS